jgi:hypothetical protein
VVNRAQDVPELRDEDTLAPLGSDYTLITHDRQILKDALPTEKPWQEIGVHGGLSEAERYVPLLLVQC